MFSLLIFQSEFGGRNVNKVGWNNN